MCQKPPLGEMRLLNCGNVTVSEYAERILDLVGPIAARQIAAKVIDLAEPQSGVNFSGNEHQLVITVKDASA